MPEKNSDINVEQQVMEKIKKGEVTMRPKLYFICGSFALFLGVASALVTALFFINITLFSIRIMGALESIEHIWFFLGNSFPWWAPVIAILGIALGIILLKQYDFSYKHNPLWVVGGFLIVVFLAGWMVSETAFNQRVYLRGPQFMRRVYRERMMEEGFRRFPVRGLEFPGYNGPPPMMMPRPFIPGR